MEIPLPVGHREANSESWRASMDRRLADMGERISSLEAQMQAAEARDVSLVTKMINVMRGGESGDKH